MTNKTAADYLQIAQDQDYEHPDEAIAACNDAIRLNPLCAEAFLVRAINLDIKGRVEEAIADCTEAIRINPNYIEAYLERGRIRDFTMGDIDGSIEDYSEAIRTDPHSWDAYMDRALVYWFDKANYDDAIADYTHAIDIAKETKKYTAYSYQSRGWIYYLKNEFDRALEDYNRAIELDPIQLI